MLLCLRFAVVICALVSPCSAQFAPCNSSQPTPSGHRDGITELSLNFTEADGKVAAHVFIPDSNTPVAGIVFSHSTIHGATTNTDLLQFARALARAGAASIVLEGTIEWQMPNGNSQRPYHLTSCANRWLLENVNVDRERLAEAGPGKWVGDNGYYCVEGEETPCHHAHVALNFGQTSDSEFRNTNTMLTPEGRLQMAKFAQRNLNLKEINPDWFGLESPRSLH